MIAPVEWFAGVGLGFLLLVWGAYVLRRLIGEEQISRWEGRDDARKAKGIYRRNAAYWEGYNQEMYGHPDGPILRTRLIEAKGEVIE